MKSKRADLQLERLLLALERDVMEATDAEIMAAARELGMNPSMKGSSAYFGVTLLVHRDFLTRTKEKSTRTRLGSRSTRGRRDEA